MNTRFTIAPFPRENAGELVSLWQASVGQTHTFLSPTDIEQLLPEVAAGLRQVEQLYAISTPDGRAAGFMGIEGDKLEMLFLHPRHIGRGLGKKLLRYAVETAGVRYVDVNEQNPAARGFYEHAGFRVFRRSALDGGGRPFPILHLQLVDQDREQYDGSRRIRPGAE